MGLHFMDMRIIKALTLSSLLFFAMSVSAQTHHRFDNKKFQAALEKYITADASLTQKEAAKFFPLYREMQSKQRVLFEQSRHYRHVKTNNNVECAKAISVMDKNDIQIKRLQQVYHAKFVRILPASKVMKVIKAENKFHRMVFERVAKNASSHKK